MLPIIVNEVMKKADQVIQFAANSHVDRSVEYGSILVRTNVLGTKTLLQNALANKIKEVIEFDAGINHITNEGVY